MQKYVQMTISNWAELSSLSQMLFTFVYRGQSDLQWSLSSSLERCVNEFCSEALQMHANREHWMLHEFRRRARLYLQDTPSEEDCFEWLAIMQHHGCPTRLLDFTESIYIAAFFALDKPSAFSVIWAVNSVELRDQAFCELAGGQRPYPLKDEMNSRLIAVANRLIGEKDLSNIRPFVIPLEPTVLAARMARQQGLFLMPTDINQPFEDNLFKAFGDSADARPDFVVVEATSFLGEEFTPFDDFPYIIKIIIPQSLQKAGVHMMNRMNLTSESLFPGIDGMARSLVQTVVRE